MSKEITKRIEAIFYQLCELEHLTTTEMADQDYINDKANSWYESGQISEHDHELIIQNWGLDDHHNS